jgi:hypothetical protein
MNRMTVPQWRFAAIKDKHKASRMRLCSPHSSYSQKVSVALTQWMRWRRLGDGVGAQQGPDHKSQNQYEKLEV